MTRQDVFVTGAAKAGATGLCARPDGPNPQDGRS